MSIPLRVLILEDRPADAELMLHELRRAGFDPAWQHVETEADYLAALDPTLDVILADYHLPQFDALRALQLLQQCRLDIPFIVVTAALSEEVPVECMKQGAADYLLKDRLARLGPALTAALEQKRLREAKRLADEALRKSEDKFAKAFRASPNVLVISRCTDGLIIETNDSWENLFEYSREEVIGRSSLELGLFANPADRQRAVAQLQAQGFVRDFEMAVRRKSGEVRQVSLSMEPIEIGNEPCMLTIIHDITGRKQCELAEAMREVGTALSATLDFEAVLDRLLEQVARVVPYDAANIMLVKDGRIHLARARGYEQFGPEVADDLATVPFDIATTANLRWMAETGQLLVIADTAAYPGWVRVRASAHMRSWAGAPIAVQGQVVAFFSLDKVEPGFYRPEHTEHLSVFAAQAALALQNARLFDQTCRSAEEQRAASDILRALNAGLDVSEAFPVVVEGLRTITGCERVSVALFDPSYEWLTMVAIDQPRAELSQGFRLRLSDSAAAEDVLAGRLHLTPDLAAEVDFPGERMLYQAGHRSRINVPLRAGERVIGGLNLTWPQPAGYDLAQLPLLGQIADAVALAIEKSRLFEETQYRAIQQEALNAIIAAATVATDLPGLLEIALDQTLQALRLEMGGIWVAGHHNVRNVSSEIASSMTHMILTTNLDVSVPLAVENWQEIPAGDRLSAIRLMMARFGIGASLTVPIQSEGQRIGGLSLAAPGPRPWPLEEIALVETVGRQLGAAAERLHLLERSREQARQLQQIMDIMPEGVILLDAEKRILQANPAAREHLAILSQARVGDVLTRLGERPTENFLKPPLNRAYHEIVAGGPPRRFFEAAAQHLEEGPKTRGWVLMLREVTEERERQERVQRQERLAAVGQLAAGIAHDFNNILTAMIGLAELLQIRQDNSELGREWLSFISQQGRRASHLINQVLDFSRQSIAQPAVLNLVPLVKESVKFLERTIPENIHLVLEIDSVEYLVKADPIQLQQVLTNLAVNAWDAMPEGGNLKLTLSSFTLNNGERPPCPEMPLGDWTVLSVSDTGTGMPPEVLSRIFEPFFTTKAPGQGTGLGLAQVYGIVQQHAGHINVMSQVGQGTTFTIYFPMATDSKEMYDRHEPEEIVYGEGETILVVEDEPAVLAVTNAMLQELGYRVLMATTGMEALEMYDRYRDEIALVLTDIVMPGMGGVELYHALKERNRAVNVLMMSGHPLEEEAKELFSRGDVNWLQKPLDMGHLARVVRQVAPGGGRIHYWKRTPYER